MNFLCEQVRRLLILEARTLLRKDRRRLGEAWRDHAFVRSTAAV